VIGMDILGSPVMVLLLLAGSIYRYAEARREGGMGWNWVFVIVYLIMALLIR